ncbi:MAG: hypothetical protein ANABAC_2614 [Anaerolineae bacterium]|nr:MAG: hypothetical protein ANABAC_2614 [Anaerolineae bacterium]
MRNSHGVLLVIYIELPSVAFAPEGRLIKTFAGELSEAESHLRVFG